MSARKTPVTGWKLALVLLFVGAAIICFAAMLPELGAQLVRP